ncbi:MAG TPA: MMPL family transporter [Pseudonocardiaceae bacterium]
MGDKRLTVRVATWSAQHPWRAIIGWFVFVALCLALGSMIGDRQATGVDYRVGEAGTAEAMAADAGLTVPAVERVLITAHSGKLDPTQALAAGRDAEARMRALPEVATAAPPVLAADRDAVLELVTMKGDAVSASNPNRITPLLTATAAVQRDFPGLRVQETGNASIGAGNNTQRGSDLALSEEITLPVTLLILLVVFGAVLAAGVPILLALSSIAASVGLSMVFSHLVPDAGLGTEVIILMGMAVGVDYSLFYLKREREERRRRGGALAHADAVRLAAATSGRAVVVSALGVALCTACLFVADDVIFSSLALAAIIVILVAMVSSLTILPALLAKLGPRIDRPRVPLVGRWIDRDSARGRFWPALLRPAARRPVLTLVLASAGMLALAAPALGIVLNEPGDNSFSTEIPAVAAYHDLVAEFPAQTGANLVVVQANPTEAAAVITALNQVANQAQHDPTFGGVTEPAIQSSADDTVHTLTLHMPFVPTTAPAQHTLTALRTSLLPHNLGPIAGARYAVSGDVAHNSDYVANQQIKTPIVVALVLIMTFVMMLLAFRSVVLGLIAVVLNLLSAGAALGALVLVFQLHWAQGLLDFTSPGFITARVPLFLFVVLFGLSMDYQIFVVSRIRDAIRQGVPPKLAVSTGITNSAGVITSAAVVMVSVFVSFMFLHLLEVKQMGFGLAVAVLLDAVVVRILILPALLTLFGRFSWWPSTPQYHEVV